MKQVCAQYLNVYADLVDAREAREKALAEKRDRLSKRLTNLEQPFKTDEQEATREQALRDLLDELQKDDDAPDLRGKCKVTLQPCEAARVKREKAAAEKKAAEEKAAAEAAAAEQQRKDEEAKARAEEAKRKAEEAKAKAAAEARPRLVCYFLIV